MPHFNKYKATDGTLRVILEEYGIAYAQSLNPVMSEPQRNMINGFKSYLSNSVHNTVISIGSLVSTGQSFKSRIFRNPVWRKKLWSKRNEIGIINQKERHQMLRTQKIVMRRNLPLISKRKMRKTHNEQWEKMEWTIQEQDVE